jgi:uncharacterized protein YoxC
MKLQFLALPLLVALMFSPMLASATSGSITYSSPVSGATYTGVASYTISGTITPTPTLPDNVAITVTLQGGSPSPLDEQTVAVGAGGTFSYSTNAGGNAAWVTGTYVITAFDSNGATGTTTFKYTATPTTSSTSGFATIEAPTLLLLGQSGNIFIWSSAPGTVTAWVLAPGSTTTTALTTTRVSPNPGGLDVYAASYSVSATATTGVYLVGATITNATSGFAASNIGSFTVNGGVATSSALATITTDVTGLAGLGTNITKLSASIASLTSSVSTLQSDVNSITSSLGTVSSNVNSINTAVSGLSTTIGSLTTSVGTLTSDVTGLQTTVSTLSSTVNTISTSVSSLSSSISTLTTDVTGLQSTVNGLGNLSGQMTSLQTSVTNLNSSVSNDQTYILVVAVLAVITLVLELAILIRKLS